MLKNRDDIVVMKKVISIYGWTGNHPNKKKYILMLMIPFHVVAIAFFAKVYYYTITRFELYFMGIIIFFLNFLFVILFNQICLSNKFTNAVLWNDLLSEIDAFDIKIGRQREFNNETIFKYFLKICLGYICYITGYFSYILLQENTDYQYIIGVSYLCFVDTQIFVTTMILVKLLNILGKRYDLLKNKLRDVYFTAKTRINYWNRQNLEICYFLLIDISRKINKIYGQRIFIIVVKTFLFVLGCFQLLLSKHSQDKFDDTVILLHSICQVFILLVSIQKPKYLMIVKITVISIRNYIQFHYNYFVIFSPKPDRVNPRR